MHVAVSIAPSYRDGISVENENNICTIATSVTDDGRGSTATSVTPWSGLDETLCGGYYSGEGEALPANSIAAE
eukprot:556470-Prymnesium_polylepis.1